MSNDQPARPEMQLDEPIPLNSLPPRMQNAILQEFKGRCPTFRQMVKVPDAYWLATPEMGPASVEKIHDLIKDLRRQANISLPQLTDAELLERLNLLLKELRCIEEAVRAKIVRASSFEAPVSPITSNEYGLSEHLQIAW